MIFVALITRRTRLRTIAPTTMNGISGEAHPIEEPVAQPTSTTVRLSPNLVTMSCAAGPRLPSSKLTTMLIPVKPIPTVIPALNALPGPTLKISPSTKKIIGIITVAPIPIIKLNICILLSPFFLPLGCTVSAYF